MYKIDKISPSGNGDRLLLRVVSEDGETEIIPISCELYKELNVKKGEISDDTYDAIARASDYDRALTKGVRILGYGSNSKKQLEMKLRHSGVTADVAISVTDELSRRGYLDEESDAIRLSDGMLRKGYGAKRILSALRSKGYSDAAVNAVAESFAEIDFVDNCTRVAKAKFKNLKNDREDIRKAIAKLVNLGYNVSEAKKALEILLRGCNQ